MSMMPPDKLKDVRDMYGPGNSNRRPKPYLLVEERDITIRRLLDHIDALDDEIERLSEERDSLRDHTSRPYLRSVDLDAGK